MNIFVGFPAYQLKIHAEIACEVLLLGRSIPDGYTVTMQPTHDPNTERNYNHMFELALERSADYLLMHDHDCYLQNPVDLWSSIEDMSSQEVRIMGAIQPCKGGFYSIELTEGEKERNSQRWLGEGKPDIFDVARVGSGYTLYDSEWIYSNIGPDPFKQEWLEDGPYSYDYRICDLVRKAGGRVAADRRLKVTHQVGVAYAESDGAMRIRSA